jgi:hypothetical protein
MRFRAASIFLALVGLLAPLAAGRVSMRLITLSLVSTLAFTILADTSLAVDTADQFLAVCTSGNHVRAVGSSDPCRRNESPAALATDVALIALKLQMLDPINDTLLAQSLFNADLALRQQQQDDAQQALEERQEELEAAQEYQAQIRSFLAVLGFMLQDSNRNATYDIMEDNDGDGILNLFEDENGDGVPDIEEDLDGDGTPDAFEDNDGDSVINLVDRCPDERGLVDLNGCPPQ